MKNAIVVGASSGIGRELAIILSRDGYCVGLVARRTELLEQLRAELAGPCLVRTADVSNPDTAMPLIQDLVDEMRDVELFIVNAGTGFENETLAWEPERETIAVNVVGFTCMVNLAAAHLEKRGAGQLVGISSLAALRGNRIAPAYNASKAFVSNYLQGMRYRFRKLRLPVAVTDVQPGFVDTRLAGGRFWISSPQKAAQQIAAAIRARKKRVYITKRWRLIAWLMRIAPDSLYSKL